MTLEDDLHAATEALGSSRGVVAVRCSRADTEAASGECGGRAIAGTSPPRCSRHGGLGGVAIAAAAVRLEAAREKIVDRLAEAVELAVETYVAVLEARFYMPGSERTVQRVTGKGEVVEVEDGVKVTARDKIRAAELVLALAGANAETLSRPSVGASDDLGGPEGALRAVLAGLPDDALSRLQRRLSAIPATAG